MKATQDSMKSGILLGLCALAAGFFLVIKPKQDEVSGAQDKAAAATESLLAAQRELKTLGPKPDDAELADLFVKVPRTEDTPAFLNQINMIGAQFGVAIGELSFSPPSEASLDIGSEVKVSLTGTGARTAIDQFLTSVAQLPRLAIIDQATISPASVVGGEISSMSGTVTANLSIVLFTGATVTKN